MNIGTLRKQITHEVFDYQQLVGCLQGYAKPRDKIGHLLASGDVVRVKKGLYVFGENYRKGPVLREMLANLIYGPSYVSLEYALSYHGLIPERVETVTSVTPSKQRAFETPFGTFTYRRLGLSKYDVGFTLEQLSREQSFLIAMPEKALIDTVWNDKRFAPARPEDFRDYLLEDLRVESARLAAFDLGLVNAISAGYRSKKVRMLSRYLHEAHGGAT